MNTNNLPAGIRDLLPSDLIQQGRLRQIILDSFRSWGYQMVLPPLLENIDAIERGRSDLVSQAFKLFDTNGQLLALRPDLTLPIARLAATRLSDIQRPLRLCYAAGIFRQKESKANLRREHYQVGIELMGISEEDKKLPQAQQSMKSNLECLSILLDTLNIAKVTDYKVVLTHTGVWDYLSDHYGVDGELAAQLNILLKNGDLKQASELLIKKDPKLKDLILNLTGSGKEVLSIFDAESIIYQELSAILELEKIFGEGRFAFDFTLRPNEEFYTGLYFDVVIPQNRKVIGSGGRYNNLISAYGVSEPAIGFSLQVDDLLACYKIANKEEIAQTQSQTVKIKSANVSDIITAIDESISLRESTNDAVILS